MKVFDTKYSYDLRPQRWYNEFHSGIRIHDYFCLMIDQFPILVIRKYDNPHSNLDWKNYSVGFLGMTFRKYLNIRK